jgi:VWFA-related protein
VRVENAYVWIGCAEDGGWGLTTIAGDPANPDDDDKILIYDTYGGTNGLSVKIDGTLYVLEDNTTYVTTPMALGPGGTYASIGWTIAGVSLTARYELVASDSGREDTARVTYTFYNPPAKTSRHLGFKVGLDTMIGDNDAARLATAAGIIDTETGFGDTGAGGTYPDPVPAFYQAFEVGDIADPGVVAQGTFVGGGATQPDKFVIGRWSAVSRGSNFDYTPTGNAYGDSAVGMWWFDRNLEAGSSMSFVVLYGLGSITAGGGDLLMALAAPAALAPAGSDFDPNPFTVLVQLQNETGTTLVNLPVTIDLPACLSPLAKGGSATQYVASLANGANTALAFLVYADPGCGGTTQTYSVTAGAGQPYAVTLEKTVDLPVVTLDCDASAWNFVHVRNTGYLNAGTFPEIVTTVSVDTPHGRACELGMANFAVAEDSVPQTITSLTCAATGGSVADLAVVFDDTGSMGGQIEDMKARASAFAEAIAAEGVDARFALVSFGDNYEIGIDLDFTSSVANFQAAVDTLFASGGGDTPEAAVDAVYRAATELSWRPGAQRFFLLITDAPTHYVEDGSGLADRGMAETVATVEAMGGSVFAVGPNLGKGKLLDNQGRAVAPKAYGDPDDVKTLAYDTGGDWQDFYAVDFNAWLDDIIDIVTSVYTVVYTSTNPARDGSWREVVVTVTDTVEDGVKTGTVVTDCDDGTYQAPYGGFECDQGEGEDFVHVQAVGYATTDLFPEITATVRVDTEAGYNCELTREDFAAWEDGVWQTITSVTCAGTGGSVADIAICFDDTGSMGGEIGTMQAEATQFVRDIVGAGVDARFALVSFKDDETIRQDFTADSVAFQAAVNALVASGGGDTPETSFDAVMLAVTGLVWREGVQRIVIVITDAPSHYRDEPAGPATYNLGDVVAACTDSGTSVFAVGPLLTKGQVQDNEGNLVALSSGKTDRPDDVRRVAEGTGGLWQDINTAEFDEILARIVRVITSLYTVVYTTTNSTPDGTWREVTIQVTDPVEGTDCDDGTYQAPYAPIECVNGQGNDFVGLQSVGYAEDVIFPQITATVRVDTEAGRNCELTREDFALSEDGVVQRITSVTCAGSAGSVADIVICFDDTGSMGGEIGTMQAEATQFVGNIAAAGVDARFALISFKDDETLRQDFTTDVVTFQNAVNALVASGGGDTPETSFDAVMLAVNGLAWRAGAQRLVIVITDAPSHYRDEPAGPAAYNLADVVDACTASGTAVFAVGPLLTKGQLEDNQGNPVDLPPAKTGRPDDVRLLAEGTGGFWQDINTAEFDDILAEIVEVITSLYTVIYTTSNDVRDGSWREVIVSVTDPVQGTDCDDGWYQAPEDCVLLEVAPLDLYAVCLTGTNPGDVCFSVANGCAGWMEYGIEWEDDWLTVSPTGGVSTWDWNEHCVEFDAAWLPPGSYEGTIYVYAGEQIEIVTVHLTVTDLLVVRDFPDDCFGPGDEVDVAVTFYFAGSSPVTSLALYETLPEGWSFVDVVSGDPRPDMQFGASSLDLEFYWLEIPAFPYTLVYRVQAPAVKTETETYGWHCFDGQAAWRTTGAENWIGVFGETCIELLDCTEPCAAHQADQDGDWLMELRVELSRMIQFYNYRGYHVRAGSEDGYDPGVGSTAGDPHQADQRRLPLPGGYRRRLCAGPVRPQGERPEGHADLGAELRQRALQRGHDAGRVGDADAHRTRGPVEPGGGRGPAGRLELQQCGHHPGAHHPAGARRDRHSGLRLDHHAHGLAGDAHLPGERPRRHDRPEDVHGYGQLPRGLGRDDGDHGGHGHPRQRADGDPRGRRRRQPHRYAGADGSHGDLDDGGHRGAAGDASLCALDPGRGALQQRQPADGGQRDGDHDADGSVRTQQPPGDLRRRGRWPHRRHQSADGPARGQRHGRDRTGVLRVRVHRLDRRRADGHAYTDRHHGRPRLHRHVPGGQRGAAAVERDLHGGDRRNGRGGGPGPVGPHRYLHRPHRRQPAGAEPQPRHQGQADGRGDLHRGQGDGGGHGREGQCQGYGRERPRGHRAEGRRRGQDRGGLAELQADAQCRHPPTGRSRDRQRHRRRSEHTGEHQRDLGHRAAHGWDLDTAVRPDPGRQGHYRHRQAGAVERGRLRLRDQGQGRGADRGAESGRGRDRPGCQGHQDQDDHHAAGGCLGPAERTLRQGVRSRPGLDDTVTEGRAP